MRKKIILMLLATFTATLLFGCSWQIYYNLGRGNNDNGGEVEEQYEELSQDELYSDTVMWFNLTHASLTVNNEMDPLLYGGGEREEYEEQEKSLLEEGWGIENREGASEMIERLTSGSGLHYAVWKEVVEDLDSRNMLQLPESEFLDLEEKNLDMGMDEENIFREIASYYAYYYYGEDGIIAWDYCRAIQLLASYYIAGYYTQKEALDESLLIAKSLQSRFDSWDEMLGSYLVGYQFWKKDNIEDEFSDSNYRRGICQSLREEGLYETVPWEYELTDTWTEKMKENKSS